MYRALATATSTGKQRAICNATAKKVRTRALGLSTGVIAAGGGADVGSGGVFGGSGGNGGDLFERIQLARDVLGERGGQQRRSHRGHDRLGVAQLDDLVEA